MIELVSLMAALTTALSVVLTTGHDLTVTGAVQRGRWNMPPSGLVPFVCVAAPRISTVQGEVLGSYTHTLEVDVIGWTAVDDTTAPSRTEGGEQLAAGMVAAIIAARDTEGSGLYDCDVLEVSGASMDLADADPVAGGWSTVLLVVRIEYTTEGGL